MSPDQLGTVRWFGASWNAPINDPAAEIVVPVGETCPHCDVVITAHDRGITLPYHDGETTQTLAYHLACWLQELGVTPWLRDLAERER